MSYRILCYVWQLNCHSSLEAGRSIALHSTIAQGKFVRV